MASKRFCDLCDKLLHPHDDQPLIRQLEYHTPGDHSVADQPKKAVAYVAITNEHNHPLTDVCIECKLKIVNKGEPTLLPTAAKVASLQPRVASDHSSNVQPFKLPEKPPTIAQAPISNIEPSLPGERPSPRMG